MRLFFVKLILVLAALCSGLFDGLVNHSSRAMAAPSIDPKSTQFGEYLILRVLYFLHWEMAWYLSGLKSALQNPRLPAEEKAQLEKTDKIARQLMMAIDHYTQNAFPPNTSPEKYLIQFADGSDPIFQLKPGEPPRSAVTGTAMDSKIIFNRSIINDPTQFSFAKAMSLMIHELGHKIKSKNEQFEIDKVAATIEQIVSPREFRVPVVVDGKKEELLLLSKSPNHTRMNWYLGVYTGGMETTVDLTSKPTDQHILAALIEGSNLNVFDDNLSKELQINQEGEFFEHNRHWKNVVVLNNDGADSIIQTQYLYTKIPFSSYYSVDDEGPGWSRAVKWKLKKANGKIQVVNMDAHRVDASQQRSFELNAITSYFPRFEVLGEPSTNEINGRVRVDFNGRELLTPSMHGGIKIHLRVNGEEVVQQLENIQYETMLDTFEHPGKGSLLQFTFSLPIPKSTGPVEVIGFSFVYYEYAWAFRGIMANSLSLRFYPLEEPLAFGKKSLQKHGFNANSCAKSVL